MEKYGFIALCIIAPYLEWTGFISNIGFAFAFLFDKAVIFEKDFIRLKTEQGIKFCAVIICTIISGLLFIFHYLSSMSSEHFWSAITSRFSARTGEASYLSELWKAYSDSFGLLPIIVVGMLLIVIVIDSTKKQFIELIRGKIGILMFVCLFALLENFIMKGHALQYTFDRMKGVFILILLLMLCVAAIFNALQNRKRIIIISMALGAIFMGYISFKSYTSSWRWEAPYLADNRALAKQLKAEYTHENSIYAQNVSVRGYTNMLFGRGVYEWSSPEFARQMASEKGKRYALYFEPEREAWNMYNYKNYQIIDLSMLTLLDFTDRNWTKGVNLSGNVLLFPNEKKYNELLLQKTPTTIATENYVASITRIELSDPYIRVHIDESADKLQFAYPAELSVK